jgi:hypothetical protein
MTVWPTQTTTYAATFTGAGGTVNCQATVTVVAPQPGPSCTLSVSRSQINAGDSIALTWTSTNASSGNISGIGSVSANGSQTLYPSQSTSYKGTFVGTNGSQVNCYASVTVIPVVPSAPRCTISANPTVINAGQPVTISWTSQYTHSGTITNIGNVSGANGSQTLYPTQSTVYQGTFYGDNGAQVNCYVTVNVNPVYIPPVAQPPYISLSQAPYTGLDLGPWGTAAYWTFLVAWCAFAAYLIAVKKVQNRLFDYVMFNVYGAKTASPKAPSNGIFAPKVEQNSVLGRSMAAQSIAHSDDTDNFVISQITRS